MKIIECSLGAVEPLVMGRPYPFTQDEYGRFTCRVDDDRHAALLLSVTHYQVVPEHPGGHPDEKSADEVKAKRTRGGPKPPKQPEQQEPQQQPGLTGSSPSEPDKGAVTGNMTNPDDIGQIKGIGEAVKAKLEQIGFVTIQQIAELSDEDVARLDKELDLKGGITRFAWIEQAQQIIAARTAGTAA